MVVRELVSQVVRRHRLFLQVVERPMQLLLQGGEHRIVNGILGGGGETRQQKGSEAEPDQGSHTTPDETAGAGGEVAFRKTTCTLPAIARQAGTSLSRGYRGQHGSSAHRTYRRIQPARIASRLRTATMIHRTTPWIRG